MFFRILFFALSLTVALSSCGSAGGSDPVPPHPGQGGGTTTVPTLKKTYNNPVIRSSVPDPTVITVLKTYETCLFSEAKTW